MINKLIEKLKCFWQGPEIVSAEYKDRVMTVKYANGIIEQYEGSCTVWNKMPYMTRCRTSTESWLYQLYKYNQQWKGAYPYAHKKHFETTT